MAIYGDEIEEDGVCVGEKRDSCRALVVEFEWKNHVQDLGLYGDNIKTDLKYIRYVVMDWIYRSQYGASCELM